MTNEFSLSYLNDNDRLKAYEILTKGCIHLWSKGKLQIDRLKLVVDTFINLADKDPYFLAHLTSYIMTKMDSKDLKVVSVFINSLSDADGTPFLIDETGKIQEEGNSYINKGDRVFRLSDIKKPNLRQISQAGLLMLEPKLALRVIQLANIKLALGERYKEATHFQKHMKTALRKYLKYRENHLPMVRGIKENGLRKVLMNLYRLSRITPSDEVAEILRWDQKDGREIKKENPLSFDNMKDIDIAKKIRDEKINPIIALGILPDKISPVIAVAVLEQTTGNQAIILHSLFEKQGLLKHDEISSLFEQKIKKAGDALDRVERMNTKVSTQVEKALKKAKSEKRKEEFGEIGKIYVHLDISPSMQGAIEFAKQKGAIIAECVKNPKENFYWGAFHRNGFELKKPEVFTQDGFMQILYGVNCSGGSTNVMACYEQARSLGCDVDIFITDQGHNCGDIGKYIDKFGKPRVAVIVHFDSLEYPTGKEGPLYKTLISHEIPTSIIEPDLLTESALVVQTIKTAVVGAVAIIDEIMATPLLKLPKWWNSVSA